MPTVLEAFEIDTAATSRTADQPPTRPARLTTTLYDLIHWQTTMVTHHVDDIAHRVRTGLFPWVSPGVITMPGNHLGFTQGILVRDPDGHVLQLVAP
jgi:hypothetical protein